MSDLISRQAAIDAILHITNCKSVRELFEYNQAHHLTEMWSGGVNDAIDAVIGVESATEKNVGTNDDCISRRGAIDALKELTANGTNKGMVFGEDAGHRIEMLPPAQPQRTGKWIRNGWAITCSECGYDMPYTVRNFCPNCGAKMTEGDAE